MTVGTLFVLIRALGTVRSTLALSLGRRVQRHLRERVMVALNRPYGRRPKVGLDEEQQTAIRIGAYLHDLGKVRVPHEILNKPAR